MRLPRQRELDLLRSLLAGPRVISEGPVGTCLKKGWCCIAGAENDPPPIRYGLTERGRFVLLAATSGDPHRPGETGEDVDGAAPSASPK